VSVVVEYRVSHRLSHISYLYSLSFPLLEDKTAGEAELPDTKAWR
jgi:hypothetical protein